MRTLRRFVIEPPMKHLRAERPGDLHGVIRAARIEDDDIVAPCNAREAPGQVRRFVLCENQDGD